MTDKNKTVAQLLAELPEDRRKCMKAMRKAIKDNIDPLFEEGVQSGMISFHLPHKVYPAGYHCNPKTPVPFVALASQKNHMGIYLFCVYTVPGEPEAFAAAWKKNGRKLDMGKSCVRVKKFEDIDLDVLGKTIKKMTAKKFLRCYEAIIPESKRPKAAATKKATKKKAAKKTARK
ncbi:MAG: hypothetical protein ACI97A_000389 [Planctomycetota bacterium]|jgi:hypothetical protein